MAQSTWKIQYIPEIEEPLQETLIMNAAIKKKMRMEENYIRITPTKIEEKNIRMISVM